MAAGPIVLALAAAGLFALALVLTQFGVGRVSPWFGATISISSATILFLLLAPWQLDLAGFDPVATAIFAGVGLFYPAVATLLTFESNRRMGPAVAGALGNLAPVFAVTIAVLLLGEALPWLRALGLAAVVAGVTLLSWDRRWQATAWPAWALLLPLTAALIRGLSQPAIKLGLEQWSHPFAAFLAGYLVSSVVVATAGWRRRPARLAPGDGMLFAAVGVCNGLAVLSLYAALQVGQVSLVSPLVATYPLITVVLSALLLRRARLAPVQVGGVAVSVGGVALLLA